MDLILYAVKSLFENKMRSFLTILGIIVGITSMMLISVIGRALSDTFQSVTSLLYESDIMNVEIVPSDDNNSYIIAPKGYIDIPEGVALDVRRVTEMLGNEKYENAYISTGYFVGTPSVGLYNGRTGNTLIYSGCVDEGVNGSDKLIKGRQISRSDEKYCVGTAVISDITERDLFGNNGDALGKQILIKSENNTVIPVVVIGVYEDLVYSVYNASLVMINHSYLEKNYKSIFSDFYWNRTSLQITLDGVEDRETFKKNAVSDLNKILDNSQWQVNVSTKIESLESVKKLVDIILGIIFIIACISLFVGSVGVMSIMIITVTERTSETGIRKAIGASNLSVIFQFLCESITLSLAGTGTGILIGMLLSKLVSIEASNYLSNLFEMSITVSPEFPAGMILKLIALAVAIGIVFGLYPAIRASRMEIVDSIQFE